MDRLAATYPNPTWLGCKLCYPATRPGADHIQSRTGERPEAIGERNILVVYNLYMSELAMSEARNRLAEAIDMAMTGEPVYVTRRGRRVAVLVDAASYDALVESAEDGLDSAALAAARVEDDYVPWEEVKADLGLR
jgi:prevent-host-death family protein